VLEVVSSVLISSSCDLKQVSAHTAKQLLHRDLIMPPFQSFRLVSGIKEKVEAVLPIGESLLRHTPYSQLELAS
jgi:hypothetical protein